MSKINFGSRVKHLRENSNLTQKELAKILGKTESAIAQIEHNKIEVDFNCLLTLSQIFHVSIDFLLGLSDIKSTHHTIFPEITDLHLELVDKMKDFTNEDMSYIIKFINMIKKDS